MNKIRGTPLLYLAIMAIMLVIIGLSVTMEYFESKLLPLLISSIVFVLAVVGLMREIIPGKSKPTETTAKLDEGKERERWLGYLANGAWIGGFVLGIYLLGFIMAIAVFAPSYMKWLGTGWLVAIISAIVTPLSIYGAFELVLKRPLYPGLLLPWLGY